MAVSSTFKNMALSLTLICAVCAALLALVYDMTFSTIEEANLQKLNGGIRNVLPEFDNNPYGERVTDGENEVYPATLGGKPVGTAVRVAVSGFGGKLVMMVGFTPEGEVYNTSILSHSETPGLGAKISDETSSPRAQVKGKNPSVSRISVSKDGGEIDAISASTITSRAFLKGVNDAWQIFRKYAPEPAEPATDETSQGNEPEK